MPDVEAARPAQDGGAQPVRGMELADELGRTAKLLGGQLTARLADHGLSLPRHQVLVELVRHGPLRLTQLGIRVGISQATASTLAESLVQDGLVERSTDPQDGRAIQLVATSEGRRRAEAWLHDYGRVTEEMFSVLSASQRAGLLSALRALSTNDATPTSP